MPRQLPHESTDKYLVYAGTGTDLIFNHGIDLPGFASFPLLEKPETRAVLANQMEALVQLADDMNVGCILDAPTWMANADRAAPLGYNPNHLVDINRDAVALMEDVRKTANRDNVLVSACIGPRSDPYAKVPSMSVDQAREYHHAQLAALKDTSVDLVTAYTFNRPSEAAGCALSAKGVDLPIVISFVLETDGCLSDGTSLIDAIEQVDRETDASALFYMVNCAHPTHFSEALRSHPRLRGVVANASSCSHDELNEAETLDEGDPQELGQQIAELVRNNPAIQVFGGCCGTDMRHLTCMARHVTDNRENTRTI